MGTKKLNKLQKREQILPCYFDTEIPQICQSIKNGVDGAADEWELDEILRTKRFLQCCLDTWEPSLLKASKKYDKTIKKLIKETLKLIDFYLKQRSSVWN